jgi:hypothetical protein
MDVLGYGLAGRALAGVRQWSVGFLSAIVHGLVFSIYRKSHKKIHYFVFVLNFIRQSFEGTVFMKKRKLPSIGIFLFLVLWPSFTWLSNAYSQTDSNNGIQPLLQLDGQSIHGLIPASIQPLILSKEIEQFLQKLESAPPNWTQLRHSDITQQSERLFQFNRQRDKARAAKNAILEKPIAFLWEGILRQYLPEYQGFSLALGPELTNTSWGTIRFKPIALPDYLVAVPSLDLRKELLARQKKGEHMEIMVLCIGTLVPDESLIYGFSHEDHQEGMILPVVSVQNIVYILKPS